MLEGLEPSAERAVTVGDDGLQAPPARTRRLPVLQQRVHPSQGALGPASGSEAVAALDEFPLEDRLDRQAESSSSSYGPAPRLRLLPSSPRGDAVTGGYTPEGVCLERTCIPPNVCACGRMGDTLRRVRPLIRCRSLSIGCRLPRINGLTEYGNGRTRSRRRGMSLRRASRGRQPSRRF